MKMAQHTPPMVFQPVTLTFETLSELKQFVDIIGEMRGGDGVLPVPFAVWNQLANITRGPGNP